QTYERVIGARPKASKSVVKSESKKLLYRIKRKIHSVMAEPMVGQREQVIFVCVHNLDVEDRIVKLRCFEKIDQELKHLGWKIVVIHHSDFKLDTTLEVVDFKKHKPSIKSTLEFQKLFSKDKSFVESVHFLHGFHNSLQRMKTWRDDVLQVKKESIQFYDLIKTHKPFLCVLWHEWNSYAHMNARISKHFEVPYMYAHEGFLSGTLGIDPCGEMAESLPAVDEDFNSLRISDKDRETTRTFLKYLSDNSLDRKMQIEAGSVRNLIEKTKKDYSAVVFYAGVNDWQTGMLPTWWDKANQHSEFYVDSYDALVDLVKVCEEKNWLCLFKPHPNVPPSNRIPKSENLIFLRHANILELIQQSDVCVTLLSTVSYQAMTHGTPVAILGRNSLSPSGAAYQLEAAAELGDLVEAAIKRENFDDKNKAWVDHVSR
ncbi:MAG: hypothetical protein AAF202_11885, partial [Pseudomonadota bacterium]